jgi:hypothetical protein
MFYDEDVTQYNVTVDEDLEVEGLQAYEIKIRRADQLRKEKDGTMMMFDVICGWVLKLTPYLKVSLSDSWDDDISKMKVGERKTWKYVYGRSGNVIEMSKDAPTIPLGYRNSAGDFCVWLVSALLVRQENEAVAHIMIDKMKVGVIRRSSLLPSWTFLLFLLEGIRSL